MKNKRVAIISGAIVAVAVVLVLTLTGSIGISHNGNSTDNTDNPVNNSTSVGPPGISPGKVSVDNYVAGTSVEYELRLHNNSNSPTTFSVGYRVPDHVTPGYNRPTEHVRDWVRISDKRPLVGAHEAYTVTIRLGMPSTAESPGDKWEFWIGTIDLSQTGNIHVELCQRWLVTMAE